MRATTRLVLAAALVLGADAAGAQDTAQRAPVPPVAAAVERGILTGTITDTAGRPLAGADIIVVGTSQRARSREDGRFAVAGIPAGDVEVVFRKLGYEATDFTLHVVAQTTVSVAVKLGPVSQKLDAVTISATVFNELGGWVIDAAGEPIGGAEVAIDGSGRSARTRGDGTFLFLDVAPGRYLLRVRRMGFRPQQRGLEMVKQIERSITFRLKSLAQELSAVEVTAQSGFGARDTVARREFLSRRRMAGMKSDLLTSDDLSRSGRTTLTWVIRERAIGWVKGGSSCVLINGDQPLIDPATPVTSSVRNGGALGRVAGGTGAAAGRAGSERIPNGGQGWSVLQTIFADQVEAVELYDENSENSRTACARFPAGSPCTCAARTPSVVVVWLKY